MLFLVGSVIVCLPVVAQKEIIGSKQHVYTILNTLAQNSKHGNPVSGLSTALMS